MLFRSVSQSRYCDSCLPWPQKGPAVTLPLGTTAPVKRDTAPLHGGQFLKPGGILIPVAGNVTQNAVPNLTVGGDIVSLYFRMARQVWHSPRSIRVRVGVSY